MATSRLSESLDIHNHGEPGVVSALGRALESAQGIVVNRIDLAKLDVLETMSEMIRAGGLLVCGSLMMAIGWVSLSVAVVLILAQWTLNLPLSAALVGGINLVAGGSIVRAGSSRTSLEPTNGKRRTVVHDRRRLPPRA